MSDKPIGEIVGRHDSDSASGAPETGVSASSAGGVSSEPKPTTGETQGGPAGEAHDHLAGLKGALDKERERASRFEKDWKRSERAAKEQAQRLATLERELQGLRTHVTKPDPTAVDNEFYSGPTSFVDKRVSEVEQRFQQALIRERVDTSKELARDRYDDFDDVEAAFVEAAAKDPSLWNGVLESRLPALQVYKRGKQILAGAGVASTSETRIAKLEAELAELRAGRDGGQTGAAAEMATAPAQQKPSVPRSNAGTRGTGVGKTTQWAGPTPLNQVFGRHRSAAR